jgi:hypothetical protein
MASILKKKEFIVKKSARTRIRIFLKSTSFIWNTYGFSARVPKLGESNFRISNVINFETLSSHLK